MTVTCGYASDNGEAPNLHDNHNVWNNANSDPSFGVSSPIVLRDLSTRFARKRSCFYRLNGGARGNKTLL